MTSPFVRRRRLAVELRTLREEAGMTTDRLSKLIHQSRMKISRLENAHIRPDLAEVMKILDILGVKGDRWHEVVRIARDAAEKGWWDAFGDAMGSRQRLYADLESGAKTIREYCQTAMPGVLQTPEFTWALVELDKGKGPIDYRPERMAEARLQRQRIVRRQGGPRYEVILDEFVVRRLAVPEAVMQAQLRHIIDVATDEAHVTVRVLPYDARIAGGLLPKSPFHLFTFADPADPTMAVADTVNADLVYTEPKEVAVYTEHYDRLREASLTDSGSLAFLEKMADQLINKSGIRT
ncbi:MAG: DNA-binding transcriptional regulator, XRE-family domain [Actinoallomurus sp.]|jgi:transcriptional regulator with XRE-family HTH domain|nr:DNA-binding transcriptional regulator, XRE-family domain [Actinoallomurus sp.]